MNAEEVRIAANALKEKWGLRNNKFKAWYDIILQVDELKQDDMESAVTNEARSLYNLALTMLSQEIPHKIPIEKLSPEDIEATSIIEDFLTTAWKNTQRRYRRRGEQSAYDTLIKYVLITGWYSIFAPIWEDGLAAEVWNPAEVFPDYDENGLAAVTHVYSLVGKKALERAKAKGWSTPTNITPKQMIVVTDYWYMENEQAHNVVLFDREAVKPDTTEAFTEIPIFTGPVAGLPDKGTITDNINFQEHYGESIVATNEKLYRLYNKQWTFALQLLRDTANPRWFEQSAGGEAIIDPANLFKRGAVFRGGVQDNITPLPVPALPVELRTDRFDVQQMLQRGGVSFAAYGSAMTAISGYLMSQITSSVKSALKPYHEAIYNAITDVDNFWLTQMKELKYKPMKFSLPKVEADYEASAYYEIQVPGDVIQRATVARMVDPGFRLSRTMTMETFFPEITNPLQEQARARKDMAMDNPIMAYVSLVEALEAQALAAQKSGSSEGAKLYASAAAAVRAQISAMSAPSPQEGNEIGTTGANIGQPQNQPMEAMGGGV